MKKKKGSKKRASKAGLRKKVIRSSFSYKHVQKLLAQERKKMADREEERVNKRKAEEDKKRLLEERAKLDEVRV